MLNQSTHSPVPASGRLGPIAASRLSPDLANADWCVGDTPAQWDVSFTDRLMHTFRGLFSRTGGSASPVDVSRKTNPRPF